MTVSLKHSKVTTKPDGTDNSLIQPSDWNAEHTLTQATNRLLGRTTAGVGATEEITVGTGLGLGSGTLTADVTSVAGRTGAVTLGVADVSGAAPLASPALTGTPTAPTAAVGTNTTQVATTAYVQAEGYLKSATAASTYAPLASPALTGAPTAPTVATADNSTAIATTAFVKAQSYLTTTTAASTYAPLASPTLTGTPTAPTAAANTNTGQIATTAFVIAQASNATPLMNGTAAVGTATLFAREDHVHPTDTTRAPLASPALTGTPTAPTAASGTNTTQIATTAYVQAEGYLKATTASTTYAPLASPNLTGTPTAPTAAANTNTTQIATTAFVVGQGYLTSSTAASTYAPLASPTFTGTVTIPAGASISGYLTTAAAAAGYVPQTAASGAATLPSGSSAQRPASPAAGQVRYNTNTGKFEGYSTTWGNLGGGAAISDTAPSNPGAGDLWWNSNDGNLYVYYTDANSSQWVSVTVGGQGQYLPLSGGDVTGSVTISGNVGIGTTSPGYKLDVGGGSGLVVHRINGGATNPAEGSATYYGNAGTTVLAIGNYSAIIGGAYSSQPMIYGATNNLLTQSAGALIYNTGGASERMRIDSSGNVGIGTSSPLTTLHTYSTNAGTPTTSGSATTGVSARFQNLSVNLDIGTYASGACFVQPRLNGDNSSNFNLVLNPNGGNVGIGTSSPISKLHVEGVNVISTLKASSGYAVSVINAAASSNTALAFQTNSVDTARLTAQSDSTLVFSNGSGLTERARITSGGDLLVGTTSGAGRLRVERPDNTDVAYVVNTNGSFSQDLLRLEASRAATNAYNTIRVRANGVDQFYVTGNGVIYAQNTTVQSASDVRMKENIRDAQEGLDVISALRPVRYDFKTGFGNDRKDQLGFIAQEIEPIFPDAVGEFVQDGETYKSVGPGALIPVLVKAVQELKAELDAAKAEIAALKGAQ